MNLIQQLTFSKDINKFVSGSTRNGRSLNISFQLLLCGTQIMFPFLFILCLLYSQNKSISSFILFHLSKKFMREISFMLGLCSASIKLKSCSLILTF